MNDTIAAIATAPGLGGISIVRISGPDAEKILSKVFHTAGGQRVLQNRMLTYGRLKDGTQVLDECMAVIMRAPASYTREDVCELQLHGGSYTADAALQLCLRCGARLANPGEFTRRAFLNGRIDLSQAEAVMALISAQGDQAHRAALRQLSGGTASFIRTAADELYSIQAGAAACIDYPEEISEEEAASDLLPRIHKLQERLAGACDERSARLLEQGLRVVLCGRPNVGKSSLLNALTGEEKAIVTSIPGTTRDIVSGSITLGGVVIHLTDTAGIRDTADPVEAIGVQRAESAMAQADLILAVLDASAPLTEEDRQLLERISGKNHAILLNKADLPTVLSVNDFPDAFRVLIVSSRETNSLQELKELLRREATVTDRLTLSQPRHIDAARRALAHLKLAEHTLRCATIDLAAIDLQAAQQALSEITGDQVEERLLDEVFSHFCVGK